MSKTAKKVSKSKTSKQNAIMELQEKVNLDLLSRLISAEGIDDKLRKQLKNYYHKRNDNIIPVKYHYSKNLLDKGRLYAENSLSLQNFKREIRHCLAKKYYYDIDIENCHPRLLLQYCIKNDIEHEQLENYVKNREDILKKISEFHELDRDEAKSLVLRLCYLGKYAYDVEDEETEEVAEVEPEKKLEVLKKFQKEMKEIASSICDLEEEIYDIVKKDETKENKKSATMSIVAQIMENKCLMAMYDYFINAGYKVGVLCFDGLMVEKNEKLKKNLKTILSNCEKYVKQKTKYEIILAEKEMDIPLSFILPQFSRYVDSDRECQEKLFKIEGSDKFKFCNGYLFIFNEKTGMFDKFDKGYETLFYYLIKNRDYFNIITRVNPKTGEETTDNYGDTADLQKKIIQFVKTAAKDDEWLEKTENTSLGYLLFKDGIYNFRTGEFTKGFNQKIVFHTRVPWKFPKYDKKEIKKALKISFKSLMEDPKPMIVALARALAGDIKVKRFYFCPGRSNAGKSYLVKMLKLAFGGYIGHFNAESLAYTSNNDSKDEAAKLRWALLTRFCRIILSNEVNMKKKLNANDIKKHSSGGDKLIGRTHNKEEYQFTPHYTPFCMLNDIPKIEPMDQATLNRLTYIEFPYVFVDEDEINNKSYYKQKDLELDEKIEAEEFIRGFTHIILDGYKDYLENGMPEFDQEVKNKWTSENRQGSEIIDLINENFEITEDENDKVDIRDMKKFKEINKNVFSTISAQRFNEILKDELKLEEGRNSKMRYWKGIKRKQPEFRDD